MVTVRPVRIDELPILRAIERGAGVVFRTIGMPEIADDEPPPLDALLRYQQAGRAWVATDASIGTEARFAAGSDRPLGYLIAEPVDGNLHIEQVSVDPAAARRGLGRCLIEHVAALARTEDRPALTLTTFKEVPWNAPYYARCGFRPLTESEWSPGLRAIRRHEAEIGLDRWPRVCMRRDLS